MRAQAPIQLTDLWLIHDGMNTLLKTGVPELKLLFLSFDREVTASCSGQGHLSACQRET